MAQAELRDFAAVLFALEAQQDIALGYPTEGRTKVAQALEMSTDVAVRSIASVDFALLGDAVKSKATIDDLTREFPQNRWLQLTTVPMAQAVTAWQRNQPDEAIRVLEPLRPYEMGTGPSGLGDDVNYFRGLAYLGRQDGVKAAAEFQRILDHQGVNPWSYEYYLAHLNLGRAYALQGDRAKARTAYQDFFAVWKDADPDVPVLVQARAEYSKLQ
jgi:tetratricopeptide (TPR) repeat protein